VKVTINEDGSEDPLGSAQLLLLSRGARWLDPTDPPTEGPPITQRRFRCNECESGFVAPAGEVTTHECAAE